MKTIKIFLSLSFLILIAYSCDPQELTENDIYTIDNVSADSGEYGGGDVEDRRGNK